MNPTKCTCSCVCNSATGALFRTMEYDGGMNAREYLVAHYNFYNNRCCDRCTNDIQYPDLDNVPSTMTMDEYSSMLREASTAEDNDPDHDPFDAPFDAPVQAPRNPIIFRN